jgi:hypothetical protein
LLILDGHGSHITIDFIEYYDQNKILLAIYPPRNLSSPSTYHTMNDEARIELDTKNMQNPVKKGFLNVKDPITSNNMDFGSKFPNHSRGGEGEYGGAAKYNGGGERTPAWGNPSRSGPFWRMR